MSSHKQNILVGLSGDLGNQMFQYAAGRSVAVRFVVPLIFDVCWLVG